MISVANNVSLSGRSYILGRDNSSKQKDIIEKQSKPEHKKRDQHNKEQKQGNATANVRDIT